MSTLLCSILVPRTSVESGDVLAPHLYDWSFDGVDDYVGVPNTTTLLYGATELTMASWVKHSAVPSGWRNVVSKGSSPLCIQHSSGGEYFEFAIQTSTGRTYVWSTTRTDLNVGKWFHVVAVWKSPTMYLYVNGALESTGTRDGVFVDTTYDFNIGRASEGSRYFPGFISTALIYSRALSAVEVQQVYSNSVVNASGLVLFLDATFFDGSKYVDLSGNGNHGTPYGGVGRIMSTQQWLWHVKALASDGLVHLRFFPNNTRIYYWNGDVDLIMAPQNTSGLIEDYAIDPGRISSKGGIKYIVISARLP
ncbi:MAG: LamG domain-containing protein [Candidatus Nezhaarchaeales archaeon]